MCSVGYSEVIPVRFPGEPYTIVAPIIDGGIMDRFP